MFGFKGEYAFIFPEMEQLKTMFNPTRFNKFSQLTREELMNLTAKDFTVSEIIEIINETPLSDRDKTIAINRYTKGMTLEDIADILNVDSRTVGKALRNISSKLRDTCQKMFFQENQIQFVSEM